jgi:putative DNA methylase
MINGSESSSPIAPVDLAQAAIGPGMAVFSKYTTVFEADGSPMSVRTALVLINRAMTTILRSWKVIGQRYPFLLAVV